MIEEAMDALNSYFMRLELRGEGIPRWGSQKRPHFGAISAAANVDLKFLLTEPCRQRIALAVNNLGFVNQTRGHSGYKELFIKNSALINNYLQWLGENGLKLPENPAHRGEVYFAQVEIEAGINRHSLTLKGVEGDHAYKLQLRQTILSASARLGVEVRVLPQSPGQNPPSFTYEQLLEKGTEHRWHELKGRERSRQQLYNTRSALKKFLRVLNIDATAPVGKEFIVDFKVSVAQVLRRTRSVRSKKKFQTEITRWAEFYRQCIKEYQLPESFPDALDHIIKRSGMPLSMIAALTGICRASLRRWRDSDETPLPSSYEAISRLESLFRLPSGALVKKVSGNSATRRFRLSQLPGFLRDDPYFAYRIIRHLPDNFIHLPLAKQQEITESIRTNILQSDDAFSRKHIKLIDLPYILKKWPERLTQEFNELAIFKTSERPPLGMKRSGKWRTTTKGMRKVELAYLFGAICLPSDARDVRQRGLGMLASNLTIALVTCPLLIDWYIRFRCEVRNRYTEHAINILCNIMSLLSPQTGWLRQSPQLASRLRPLSCGSTTFVSKELIKKARTSWDQVCDEAIASYVHLIEEMKPLVKISRDPFKRIEGIVNRDDPMSAMETMIRGLKEDLPNPHTQPMHYHLAIRDCALILLIYVTGLRRNTISQMDYTGGDSGHLVRGKDSYQLTIPRHLFKEENSPFFGPKFAQDIFRMTLPNVLGLNEIFDEYLKVSRPWLLNQYHPVSKENPLFVIYGERRSVRMSPFRVTAIYLKATGDHLAENKWRGTGIAGVRRHGPHSARHMRGTAMVKKTGSFQAAADANHNSEMIARKHYARFLTKDRNKRVNDVLFANTDDPAPAD